MTEKTCSNCKHYVAFDHWATKGDIKHKCIGKADEFANAEASDNWGMTTWFSPAATFSCNGWEKKD